MWRCGAARRFSAQVFLGRIQTRQPFLCQVMINRSTPNEVHQLFTVWRVRWWWGGDRGREEPQTSCQCDSDTVRLHSHQHPPLNFLPFPTPGSFRSMLSTAPQGCLVTTDQHDAFSLLGWRPYKKSKAALNSNGLGTGGQK